MPPKESQLFCGFDDLGRAATRFGLVSGIRWAPGPYIGRAGVSPVDTRLLRAAGWRQSVPKSWHCVQSEGCEGSTSQYPTRYIPFSRS